MGQEARDFAAEVAELERKLGSERQVAVVRLRAVREAWARALLGLNEEADSVAREVRAAVERGLDPACAKDAARHLAGAEKWQWEIGSWATGSGEGLSSMFKVRALQLADAWLLSVAIADDPDAAAEVRRLIEAVDGDPNDVAARLRKHLEELIVRTQTLPPPIAE